MNTAEKEFLFRGWTDLSNEAIVKDVSTKGKYINLAIGFLSKRMDVSIEETKQYFRIEVNKYVERLLLNKQVYKAEHVLNNVNVNPTFYLYEFIKTCDQSDDEVELVIVNYLKKTLGDEFERVTSKLNAEFKALNILKNDELLSEKYLHILKSFTLEHFRKVEQKAQRDLLVDVCFRHECEFLIGELDKHATWTYLLEQCLFVLLTKWIDSAYGKQCDGDVQELNRSFENMLQQRFTVWEIDNEMITDLTVKQKDLPNYILNNLAKRSVYVNSEKSNIDLLVKRVVSSESQNEQYKILSMKPHSIDMIKSILDRNLGRLLIEEFVNGNDLLETVSLYPHCKEDIELCTALKKAAPSDIATISSDVTAYIFTKSKNYLANNPLVLLTEMLLQDISTPMICSSTQPSINILNKIPLLKTILHKFESAVTQNDYNVNLADLIKRFENVDLTLIQSEAGDEELNFSNKCLWQKVERNYYEKLSRLGYIFYIKHHRSAYAIYIFLIEQLLIFGQITNNQIMCACTNVSELAVTNFEDRELVTHCFSFMEMLNVNTMHLRAYLKCLRWIKDSSQSIDIREEDLVASTVLESVVLEKLQTAEFQSRELDAVRMVFDTKKEKLPTSFLMSIAETRGWFQMIVFAMYFNYNLEQVLEVCDDVKHLTNVGTNLKTAIRWEILPERWKRRNSLTYREHKRKKLNKNEIVITSGETMSSSISSTETIEKLKQISSKLITSEDLDLFAIIIQSVVDVNPSEEPLVFDKFQKLLQNPNQIQSTTHLNLLRNSLRLHWPVLAVLAAVTSEFNVHHCWIIWMITSMDSYEIPIESMDIQDLSKTIMEFSIINGFVRTLHQGITIFFPHSNFNMFTEYLVRTKKLDFSSDVLQRYLVALSQDDVELLNNSKTEILNFSIVLLVHHLHDFESQEHQRLLLKSLCQSGISDFNNIMDFCMMSTINDILSFTSVKIDITSFMRNRCSDEDIKREYERMCEQLLANKEFSKALKAADLFNFPKDNIIYESWISAYDSDYSFDLDRCEKDIEQYSLSPELVINFYIHVADRLGYEDPKKYKILKKILDVIKKNHLFPNECFDRDRIENEMVMSFLKNSLNVQDLDMYYSEYFECIMSKERFVLYKSFLELKEMAGIEDLTLTNKKKLNEAEIEKLNCLMNRLLDDGDIVQALRIQSIFNHRPLDLHYLVFCMALAEGLATLYDLSGEQRKMLSDGVKSAASKFNRRTLQSTRLSQTSASSSPQSRPTYLDTSDNSNSFDFEEIPSREKQDVLEALQSLAARVNHGTKIGHRIAMTSRAAMYLDKEYVDVLKTKDPYILLHSAIDEDCLNKLVVISDIMTSMEMTHTEIVDFLAEQIAISIIKSRFYLFQTPPNQMAFGQNLLWGYNLDKEFRLFLELCPSTSMLGNALLKYCDALKLYRKININKLAENHPDDDESVNDGLTSIFEKVKGVIGCKGLSHKKQNTINVELIIKAHDCFVHECYMEGIALVLQRAKNLNSVLANAKSWGLIVKMLIGIGRYRDMYYCFETLIKNEQFESLLGQFDDDKSNGLKQAIISYLNEHCPDDTDNYRLTAVHFSMYKELSEMAETDAKSITAKVIAENELRNDDSNIRSPDEACITYLRCSQTVATSLTIAMEEYGNAAENYLLDNKLNLAQRAAYNAELMALQIDLINREIDKSNNRCICVVNIRSGNVFRSIVYNNLSVPQSIILSHAYPYEINWTEAMFHQYILLSNEKFLCDFCDRLTLTDEMIENLVKNFQIQTNVTIKMEQHISNLVEMVDSVTVRYRLASLLGLKRLIAQLINENSLFYLKDTNYGRNEETSC